MANNKSFFKFITGKSKRPVAKVYAENADGEFQYYVYSKKALARAYKRISTNSVRLY